MGDPLNKEGFTTRGSIIFAPKASKRTPCFLGTSTFRSEPKAASRSTRARCRGAGAPPAAQRRGVVQAPDLQIRAQGPAEHAVVLPVHIHRPRTTPWACLVFREKKTRGNICGRFFFFLFFLLFSPPEETKTRRTCLCGCCSSSFFEETTIRRTCVDFFFRGTQTWRDPCVFWCSPFKGARERAKLGVLSCILAERRGTGGAAPLFFAFKGAT